MKSGQTITLKDTSILEKKKKLNLAMNVLISVLGISSLFIKFFLIDGIIAFRAFTVDGNLFTTIVSVFAVIVNIKELASKTENDSRTMFFLQLASAVTEAVIFIVVMIGYLPFVADTPKITPYHMFCLHVAIPVLAVARFIFFEKPLGILKPSKLLTGAIPIGVYGIGVVTAIKLGILPTSFVPYSFLDFEHNFIWYFLFALFAIPAFGYLWAWMFYRLNLKASVLWYKKTDLEQIEKERIRALSSFDVVNSSILIVFCMLAVLLLSFSLMTTSNTSSSIQQELMSYMSYLMLELSDSSYGDGEWKIIDGALYKGDFFVSDGTEDDDYEQNEISLYTGTIYIKASDMVPEMSCLYNPDDYVAVRHGKGIGGGADIKRGDVLSSEIVKSVMNSEDHSWYEQIKIQRELTEEEEKYREQLRNTKESYFHFCMTFGATMLDDGVGIIELYIPGNIMTEQIKNAEYNGDIAMTVIIFVIFTVLYIITHLWIRTLEKSVDFLRDIASGRTPEEPIKLGKTLRVSGLERQLNILREINLDRITSFEEDEEKK